MSWPPLSTLGADLRAGRATSLSWIERVLAAIAADDPAIGAFVAVDPEGARAQAREADARLAAGEDRGPLHGVPVAIKDVIDTFDLPTTMGSAHFSGHRPAADAACVRLLREAGAVIVGKTLTHAFAFGPTGDRSLQGASANPRDRSRMTGGSSAGSAAAVAAGMVPLAIGTDTGGSVRIPAALCGVVGFKPAWGDISLDGVFPLAPSLDCVGILAAHEEDVAIVFRVLSGRSTPVFDRSRRAKWVPPAAFLPAVDPDVVAVAHGAAVQRFGALEELDLTPLVPRLQSSMAAIQRSEAYDGHADRVVSAPELYEPELLERLRMSAEIRGWQHVRALRDRAELRAAFAEIFAHVDLLVLPTVAVVAPPLRARTMELEGREVAVRDMLLGLTSPWNVLGLAAMSVPAGKVRGLPVGLQWVARR